MKNNYVVYVHTNKINGKKYVGITSQNITRRWRKDGSGYRTSTKFYKAILKYGFDSFLHEIVGVGLSKDEACSLEQHLIAVYDTYKNGYNASLGGESTKISTEQKVKISQTLKNYFSNHENPFKGRKHSEDSKTLNRDNHFCLKVAQYDLTGSLLNVFPSIKNASVNTGVSQNTIKNICEGVTKKPKTYMWKYFKKEE